MGAIRIRSAADIEGVTAAFDEHRARVVRLLPDVEVRHVGATSVPRALTKGDVDLLVRVEQQDFAMAVEALGSVYAVHQTQNWTSSLASFTDRESFEPPIGVQLVVAGSAGDALFEPFRDALISDPALLAEYNALKLRLDGEDYERYTSEKGKFVERVLREINGHAP